MKKQKRANYNKKKTKIIKIVKNVRDDEKTKINSLNNIKLKSEKNNKNKKNRDTKFCAITNCNNFYYNKKHYFYIYKNQRSTN